MTKPAENSTPGEDYARFTGRMILAGAKTFRGHPVPLTVCHRYAYDPVQALASAEEFQTVLTACLLRMVELEGKTFQAQEKLRNSMELIYVMRANYLHSKIFSHTVLLPPGVHLLPAPIALRYSETATAALAALDPQDIPPLPSVPLMLQERLRAALFDAFNPDRSTMKRL